MTVKQIQVPDIGGDTDVDVIEILVSVGDHVDVDTPLVTLESEKASMDVPSTDAGVVESIAVQIGDKVSEGAVILSLSVAEKVNKKTDSNVQPQSKPNQTAAMTIPNLDKKLAESPKPVQAPMLSTAPVADFSKVHAGPAVRRFARELGVDLNKVTGSGAKGRIVKIDVQAFVKQQLQQLASGASAIPKMPDVDFSQFGEIEKQPLSKINKFSGKNLHRNWLNIPHVTQFDLADITDMEAFRQSEKQAAEKQGFKLTPLVFIMKAVAAALRAFPKFNASLDANGENLIIKKYFNIGVAVDTSNGLVVPVIRDVNKKTLFDLAKELGDISEKARVQGLTPKEMQGSCFTISSLGGIGGTAFTPIINAPDVAILGVSKSSMQPVYDNGAFVPRLMLPLSLSYDHRVIDGAEGARFCRHLVTVLSDIRNLLL